MFLLAVCGVALLGALLVSGLLTWLVRSLARKNDWVKGPESDRHIHNRPIPRLGGVAVYCTFAFFLLFETRVVNLAHLPESAQLLLRMLMPATLMFLVGLADDLWNVRPIYKLFVQIVAGAWLWQIGCRIHFAGVKLHGVDYSILLSLSATVLWVVILSNAFNLIDGLDGLAAGSSVFPLIAFSAVAIFHHNGQLGVASLILTGALLGFLRFNFNPATIFLGDCGSLFLGFMLSALSLAGDHTKAPALLSVALPVVACGFPIAETCVSILRRFLSGRPIFAADREHIHHRLLKLGFTHRQVVILLFGVSGICSLLSIVLLFPKLEVFLVVATALTLLLTVGVGKLDYPEFKEIGRLLLRVREQKVVIAQNVRIRQIASALEHAADWEYVSHVLHSGLEDGDFSGFRLRVYDHTDDDYNGNQGTVVYTRSVLLKPDLEEAQWSLNLEFQSETYRGHLELNCPYSEQSLMIDVNVLLQVLSPALCRVCRNVTGEERYLRFPERIVAKRASVGFD